MWIRGLDIHLVEGARLSDADIDAMYSLRARFMALKPEVRPDDDRALFAAWLRAPGETVALARDRAGDIQVFIEMNSRVVEHRGREHLLLYGNFIFASEAYRNHPAYVLGNFANLAVHLRRHPIPRVLWLTALYPPSFVAGVRTFRTNWVVGEPGLPAEVVELVDTFVPTIFGASWWPERRLVRMRTIPRPYTPSSPVTEAILRRYEAQNPNWREGFAVLNVTPLTLGNLIGCVNLAMRRALGRREPPPLTRYGSPRS